MNNNGIVRIAAVAFFLFACGCSSEMAKRAAYDSLRNKAQMDCQHDPGAPCPDNKSYDEYQRGLDKRNEPVK